MSVMQVEVVSAERRLWSGEAQMVVARTVDGEIGILPGHAPLLGELGSGTVRVIEPSGSEVVAAIHGGFLSVSDTGVSVLADIAEMASDIDVERARAAYDRAQQALTGEDDAEGQAAVARAAARLKAAGQTVPV